MTQASAKLLGKPVIALADEVIEPKLDKPVALLFYLAYRGDWVSREAAMLLFWPEVEEERARNNLRQLLLRAKRLKFAQDLEVETRRLRWSIPTDVQSFWQALSAKDWEKALALYRGPFLEGLSLPDSPEYERWLEVERQELHAYWREALLARTQALERRAKPREAAALLGELLQRDPLDEEALGIYLKNAALAGQREEALQAFAAFSRALAELDLTPTEATLALHEAILDQRVSPLKTASQALPAQATPFVGRARELEEIVALLGQPGCRLLTLLGPGGIGKTRLALETAAREAPRHAHGAMFVPLVGVGDPALLPSVIADALGLELRGREEPKVQLLRELKERELLLVLDNLEHLLAGAGLIAEMLAAAPALKVLATSRERLNLQAEWVFPVMGMALPEGSSIDVFIDEADAARLFLERARRLSPKVGRTEADRQAVVRICRLVEGMPLALELAAAWSRALSLAEIASELERNLDFLAASTRDLEGRHRSMRAVFDRSWSLLSTEERKVFARLSLFRGFRREAAERVAGASLPILAALVDKSFIARAPSGRYAIHELLRQYGTVRLGEDTGDLEEARARHAGYYAAFARARRSELDSEGRRAVEAVGEEIDNLRLALDWTTQAGRADLGLALGAALWRFWLLRGDLSEGRARLQELLELDWEESLAAERAKVLSGAAMLAQNQGAYVEARALLEGGLALWQRLEDKAGIAATLNHLGWLGWRQGRYGEGRELSQEALNLHRELDNPRGIATSYNNLGWLAHHQGDFGAAARFHAENLALRLNLGDERGIAFSRACLGWALRMRGELARARAELDEAVERFRGMSERQLRYFAQAILADALRAEGNHSEARALLETSLKGFSEIGDAWGVAAVLGYLAENLYERGALEEARKALEESLRTRREIGDRHGEASALAQLARLELASGDVERARHAFERSLAIARDLGDKHGQTVGLEGLAAVAAREGEAHELSRLCAAALHFRAESGAVPSKGEEEVFKEALQAAKEALGEEALPETLARPNGKG